MPATPGDGRPPSLEPGRHGGDGPKVARALGLDPSAVLDLSQSLNPVAPPVGPVIARHLDALDLYPDATDATQVLADTMGIAVERLVLTNGGAEAIALVADDLGWGWVEEPEFSLYRRHLRRIDPDGPRFRSNPRNPTGLLAAADETAAVWDEAFYPLATGTWTRGDADRGAIVVGSLTKLLACPGLRIGYVIAPDDEVAARLRHRQPEWSVNGLAAAALPELLGSVRLAAWAKEVAVLRDALIEVLARHGLAALPSDANWVMVPAVGLREALLPAGIVVRDCASFGMDGVVRIAVPGDEGRERLDRALAERA